jgi:hypothetical protein
VAYPGGNVFTVSGRLSAIQAPNAADVYPMVDDGVNPMILDPRALITAADGRVVFGLRPVPTDADALTYMPSTEGRLTAHGPPEFFTLLVQRCCYGCGKWMLSGRPSWEAAVEAAAESGRTLYVVCRGCVERVGPGMTRYPMEHDERTDARLAAALARWRAAGGGAAPRPGAPG